MSTVNYAAEQKLLVVARGHPYQRDTVAAAFDSLGQYNWSLVEQPAAQRLFGRELAQDYAAVVCYDMPGVDFTVSDDPPGMVAPEQDFIDRYLAMLEAGMGMVFLHHAIAAWPAWSEYAEIVGGRFHYRPARLRGEHFADSGYRHEVVHELSLLEAHPVTADLPSHFTMTDELYLCPTFTGDVIPLLASDYSFSCDNFYSAKLAVEGVMHSREGWQHPPGSNIVGWVKHYLSSPIVYLQGGDNDSAWNDPNYRRLLGNAIAWVASDAAHEWAREQHRITLQ